MTTLLHLTGSAENAQMAELSTLYAADCLEQAGTAYEHLVAHVSPDGAWRFPRNLTTSAISAAEPLGLDRALRVIAQAQVDVALPQMFCRPGMTSYRALLDLLEIPYVGNSPQTMAIGTDKAWTRAVVSSAGVAVPRAQELRRGQGPELEPPVVVKPADADNSTGVGLVREAQQYGDALDEAFRHSDRVLVEKYVELGREVRCGVLERDGDLLCLPLEEYAVDAVTKPIRHESDKLSRSATGALRLVAKDVEHAWIVPTPDPVDTVTQAVWEAAATAHRALGCRDYSLFDFRIDPEGRPWFLEAGLYCSFARTSVVTTMAAAAGITLADLLDTCVRRAIRHPERGYRRLNLVPTIHEQNGRQTP